LKREHAKDIERIAVLSDRVWIKSWVKVGGLLIPSCVQVDVAWGLVPVHTSKPLQGAKLRTGCRRARLGSFTAVILLPDFFWLGFDPVEMDPPDTQQQDEGGSIVVVSDPMGGFLKL
jgi:hypothetical protein